MIHRRDFLGGLLALAGGPSLLNAASDPTAQTAAGDAALVRYLADLSACDLRPLGVPRNPSLAGRGFHPVTPGRVVVVDDAELRGMSRRHRGLRRLFRGKE